MRTVGWLGFVCGLALTAAADVDARGGNDRGPNGAVPPGAREPADPTPPPPPPAISRSTVPPPGGIGPTLPTPVPPRPPRAGPRQPGLARDVISFADWPFWDAYRRERLEPRTSASLALSRDRSLRKTRIAPALLAVARNAKAHQATRSAALIALAKVSTDPAHIKELCRVLLDADASLYVRESAVLALGHLRRSRPAEAFAGSDLDTARSVLRRVMESEEQPARARAFATISLALLADQPTERVDETAARIVAFALQPHPHPDLRIGGLAAAGALPPDRVPAASLEQIRTCWREGLEGTATARGWLTPHAALALGRLGSAADVSLLAQGLASDRTNPNEIRSALLGLGHLAVRSDDAVRADVLGRLAEALTQAEKDDTLLARRGQIGLALMTMARVLRARIESGEAVPASLDIASTWLLPRAEAGTKRHNSFAVLGLGRIAEVLPDETPEAQAWLRKTHKIVRRGFQKKRSTARDRGAYALALVPLAETRDIDALVKTLADRKGAPGLRAVCATALGRLGRVEPQIVIALRAAADEQRNQTLTAAARNALGLLADATSRDRLLGALARERNQQAQGTAIRALANLGSAEAVDALIEIVEDPTTPALARGTACSGLGRMGDPEPTPALSRITLWMNWRGMSDTLNEIAGIL